MPYFKRDKDGKQIEMPVTFARSPDYKIYYVHGVQGGILSSHHYRMDFYRDDVPPIEGGIKKGGIIEQHQETVCREIDLSLYISLAFAKQLRDWLDRNITKHEDKYGEIMIASEDPIRED